MKKNKENVNILGVNVSKISKPELISQIKDFLKKNSKRQHLIFTPNPEMILEAAGDEEFFYILNRADIAIPDGIGLKAAAWISGKKLNRITGSDLTKDIFKLAQKKDLRVGIIKPRDSLSTKKDLDQALKANFPDLKFFVTETSSREVKNFKNKDLYQFKPQVILASLGAPFQEKLLFYSLKNFPGSKLGIGIGGSLDFISGKISRAPKPLRVLGLEWLWRLIKQPKRWKRILRATILFPCKFLHWKFILPFLYRSNVICFLYKKEKNSYKVLVVERQEKSGQWQLPQGGTEGEDLVKAGTRELQEELNCSLFKPKASFNELHKYRFPWFYKDSFSKHSGYKGQKQGLFIAEFTGSDDDIKINFWEHRNWKWVDLKDLERTVQPVRREVTRKIVKKFQKSIIK